MALGSEQTSGFQARAHHQFVKGQNTTLTSRFRNRRETPKTFSRSYRCGLGWTPAESPGLLCPAVLQKRITSCADLAAGSPRPCLRAKRSRACPFQRILRPIFRAKLIDSGHDAQGVKNSLDPSEAIRGHAGKSLYRVSAPSHGEIFWNTNLLLAVPLKKMRARVLDLQI